MKKTIKIVFVLLFITLFFSCNSTEKPVFEKGEIITSQPFDSTVFHYDTEVESEGAFTSYHRNGRIKEVGQQAQVNGCGMYDGEFREYDDKGNLVKISMYVNHKSESCHETETDIFIIEFHLNGKIKAKKQIRTCYECDEFKNGEWSFYNQNGALDSSEVYKYKEQMKLE